MDAASETKTSLCDRCRSPGRCCTGLALSATGAGPDWMRGRHSLEVYAALATAWHGEGKLGLPFLPLMRREDGTWRFWCPVLGRDGRCGDYANRPDLCRAYEAGSDRLCAMHGAC